MEEDWTARPFTAAQAREFGVSSQMLRGSGFQQVLRSVYVSSEIPITLQLRAEAALLLVPAGVLSHHTALELWGACGPTSDELQVSVRRDPRVALPRVNGVRIHEVQDLQCVAAEGLPLTPPVRTFLNLANHSDLIELVTAGDSLVRRTGVSPAAIMRGVASTTGARGIRLARQAACLVRRGVDSPMETRLRLLLVLSGLPEPEVGQEVHFSGGGWLAQPDLSYRQQKIAIEYDGKHHLENARQWRNDIARRENLEREGWLVRVITAADLFRSPAHVVTRIFEDLRDRGHPALPRHPSYSPPFFPAEKGR